MKMHISPVNKLRFIIGYHHPSTDTERGASYLGADLTCKQKTIHNSSFYPYKFYAFIVALRWVQAPNKMEH